MPKSPPREYGPISRRSALRAIGAGLIAPPMAGKQRTASGERTTSSLRSQDSALFEDDFEDGELAWTDVDHPEYWSERGGRVRYRPTTSAGSRGDNALYADATVDGDRGTLTWPLAIEFVGAARDTSASLGALAVVGGPRDWGETRKSVRMGIADNAYKNQFHVWNSAGEQFDLSPARENGRDYTYRLIPDISDNVLHIHRDDESWTVPEPGNAPLDHIAVVLNGGTCWGCGGPGHRSYDRIRVWKPAELRRGSSDSDERQASTRQIVRLSGRPATNATVDVYDANTIERTVTTSVDSEGKFEFPFETLQGRLLVAQERQSDGRLWFTTRAGRWAGRSGPERPLRLNRELLFGPSRDGVENAVSLWRWIDPDDHERQIVKMEITEVRDSDEFREATRVDPWQVDTWPRDDAIPAGLVQSAVFSLTVPESVDVTYTGPTAYGVSENNNVEKIADWHPLRQPTVPTHSMGPRVISYEFVDETESERRERFFEGVNRLVQSIPLIGDPIALGETIQWAIGEQIEGIIGDEYADPNTETDRPSPNVADSVTKSYHADATASSVVYEVPVTLPDSDTLPESTWIAEAQWTNASGMVYRFGKGFEIEGVRPGN